MNSQTLKIILATGITAALAACGGGSSGGSGDVAVGDGNGGSNTGGIEGTGVRVFASIDGFGSVIVSGKRFDVSGATIEVNDTPASEDALKTGDVVFLSGSIDDDGNASADSIVSDDIVEGPVEQIDLVAETFVVLGQTVTTSVDTAFDDDIPGNGISGLSDGLFVEVSGFRTADGVIRATRVDDSDDNELQVIGEIANVDTVAMTFEIGALTVDYSQAVLDDFGGADPADGDIVEAEGNSLRADGALIALELERFNDDFAYDEDDEIEIEGVVTNVISDTAFEVNGIEVSIDGNTRFENGQAADLVLNAEVDVDAIALADGSLLATEIEFEDEKIIEIDGVVEAVDAEAGTLQVLGITIRVDAGTRFEDDSEADLRRFSLNDISVGDFVEIGGSEAADAANEVIASLLKRDDDNEADEASLRARVQSVSEPTFTMLGVTVTTTASTEFGDENSLTAEAFFATAQDRIVEAEGTWDGMTLIADKVEFEEEDDSSPGD